MKKKKLWAGRFSKNAAEIVEKFTESISFDQRLAFYDIKASIAHVQMLAKAGIVSAAEAKVAVNSIRINENNIVLMFIIFVIFLSPRLMECLISLYTVYVVH